MLRILCLEKALISFVSLVDISSDKAYQSLQQTKLTKVCCDKSVSRKISSGFLIAPACHSVAYNSRSW